MFTNNIEYDISRIIYLTYSMFFIQKIKIQGKSAANSN